jgi:hypothetical protein
MAGGKLSVEIGADITDFEKKIKEVEFDIKELSKVKLDRLKLGLDTTEINSQIKDAKANLNSLKTSVKDTGQTFASAAPKVANAGNTLTQFSRIAQDAPFGIIGIGNNITATAESFANLKNQTGSTGGALKALASSLAGTGGILLGVSLLTTGLTLLSQSGLTVGDVIDKITGNFDEFGATIKKISIDAAKSSGQEIAGLNALVSVAQDEVNSRKDRLIAVEELQSKYPGYFANLTKEQILTGDLTAVTKELSKAIIARAEASAIADKIGELAAKKLDLQIQKEKELIDLQKAQTNVKQANENLKIANNIAGAGQRAAGAAGALALSASRVKDLNEQILAIQTQQDKLAGKLNQKTEDSIKLLDKKDKATKLAKTFATPTVTGVTNAIISAPLFDVNGIATFNGQVDEFGNKLKSLPNTITASLGLASQNMRTGLTEMQLALIEFNASANDLIVNSIASTFSQIGAAIGDAIATGGDVLSAIGTTIIQAFAGFLSDMGDLLIKYGTLAVVKGKLDLAIAAGGPISIGAGIAAIAVGVALKAAAGALGSFASSGGNRGGGGGSANNQSFSSSGFSGGGGGGTVVFEISGQKLIGVLSNTINANRRLGGTLGLG